MKAPSNEVHDTALDDDEISFTELIVTIRVYAQIAWRERLLIWRALAVTVPLGLIIAFGSTPEYTAKTRILPYRSPSGSASGLSGLVGIANLRLQSSPTDPTITADLYPEVARTTDFLSSVADAPIWFSSLGKSISPVRYFQQNSGASLGGNLWKYTIGLPTLILSKLTATATRPKIPESTERTTLAQYSPEYLSVIGTLTRRLDVSMERKTGIITIVGTMPDAYAAADLVNVASAQLMKRIMDFESRKAGEQKSFVEKEQSRARERFEIAQQRLASFTDRNRGTLSAAAQIEAQRLQSEYNLTFELYRQFSTELEQSRIRQNQDTPVFAVLDQVVVPNSRSSPRRSLNVLVSIAVGVLSGLAIIYWRNRR